MQHDFLHSYRTLGIAPGAEWAEVRAAYRTKVRTWHPDRFSGHDEQKQFAEEQTKTINKAYRQLADFYRKHGTLPFCAESDTDFVRRGPAFNAGAVNTADEATAFQDPGKAALRFAATILSRGKGFGLVALLMVGAYLLVDLFIPQEAPVSRDAVRLTGDRTGRPVPTPSRSLHYFTVGSTLGEVYTAQGVPSRTEQDVWHYGTSKIYFTQGKVVRWEETPDHPLRAQIGGRIERDGPDFFTAGSTKSQVRSAQGAPVRETDRVWEYGGSRVYFEGGRVVGWDESPIDPLKVKKPLH